MSGMWCGNGPGSMGRAGESLLDKDIFKKEGIMALYIWKAAGHSGLVKEKWVGGRMA